MRSATHELRLLVRDNGLGIDQQVLRSGRDGHWGISGMRERAERIGGKLKVWSRPADGTEVELSVPGHVAFRSHSKRRGLQWFNRSHPQTTKPDIEKQASKRKK
jgi:signal transduction histidine kinase